MGGINMYKDTQKTSMRAYLYVAVMLAALTVAYFLTYGVLP
jgi:hypothetical protein